MDIKISIDKLEDDILDQLEKETGKSRGDLIKLAIYELNNKMTKDKKDKEVPEDKPLPWPQPQPNPFRPYDSPYPFNPPYEPYVPYEPFDPNIVRPVPWYPQRPVVTWIGTTGTKIELHKNKSTCTLQ